MAICPNCSSEIIEGAAFCTNCGTPVAAAPAAPAEPTYAPAEPTYAPEQPAYAQPVQPAYTEQPAYAQPVQPAYTEQPAYAQPVQPAYTEQPYAQPVQPAYTEQPYAQPTYQQPVYQQPAPVQPASTASKIMGPIGFGLGLTGFVFGIIVFFMTVGYMGSYYYDDELASAFGMAFAFIGFAIAGIILSGKARSGGNLSALPKLGKVFGIIGTALCGLDMLLALIGLA